MKLLIAQVALIYGVTLAFAGDLKEKEQKVEEKVKKDASAVKGKMNVHVTKNVRRLQAQSGTGFAKDKQAAQAAKQTIAKAAHTEADKVKVHVNEPAATGRRLIGENEVVVIEYILEALNSTDAQAKHDLLVNTTLSMLTLEFTNALVAQEDPIYTVQVNNHTVGLASQDDLAAFESEEVASQAAPSPPAAASPATSGVKGSLQMQVTKNVNARRLQAQNTTGFSKDKKAAQAAKQTIAKAAHTEADKVKVNVHEPAATGRRLIGQSDVVVIDYVLEASNDTDAQAKHDLLANTALSMFALELTNALVASGDGIYTIQVNNHSVELASQDDLAAFQPEAAREIPEGSATADKSPSPKADGNGGASWVYWALGAFGVAGLGLCAYFCISSSQKEKKKKEKKSSKRGVELSPPAEASLETAPLAANPSPTPLYQPQVNPAAYPQQFMYSVPQVMPVQPAQFMQPVQYVQYSQVAQPVQYVQNVQVGEMEPMAMASVPVQYG